MSQFQYHDTRLSVGKWTTQKAILVLFSRWSHKRKVCSKQTYRIV